MTLARRRRAALLSYLLLMPCPVLAQDAETILPTLVVTADRRPEDLTRTGSAITVIPAEEVQRSAATSLAGVLQTVPGVYVHEQGGIGSATTATLRGSSPGQTLVLLDGLPIGDPTGTDTAVDFGAIAATDIERIEVLRGPQTALYGSSAMGGVINIITRRGNGDPVRTVSIEAGSYGLIHGRASLSGGTDRFTYAISIDALHASGFPRYGYRIGRLQGLLPPAPDGDPTDRGGTTGRFTWKLSDTVDIETGFAGYGNLITFDNPYAFIPADVFSRFNRERQWTAQAYAKATAMTFDGRLKNALTVFANLTDRTVGETESCPPDFSTSCYTGYRGTRTGIDYQGDANLGRAGILVFGAGTQTEHAQTNYDPAPPGAAPRIAGFNVSQTTDSAFALHSLTLADQIDLSFGGRIDSVEGGARFPTWRSTIAWRIPGTATRLRASAGTGAKSPSLYQRFSAYGTPGLQPETSTGIDAGIDQSLVDGRLTLSATAFYNAFHNLIDYSYFGCDAAHPLGCYFNVGRAETKGFEGSLDAVLVPDEWRTRASYTYLWSRDMITGQELLQRPAHKGVASLIYSGIPKLEVEGRVTLVGSRLDYGNIRLLPYARLDSFASYKLTETVTVFARVENLTDARYEEVYDYGVAGRSIYGGVKVTW